MTRRARSITPLIVLVMVAAAPAAIAQGTGLKVYGAAGYVSPLSQEDITIHDVTESVKASSQVGWDVGVEIRLGKRMGLDLDYLNSTNDVKFGGTVIGKADFSPLGATLNFHLVHTRLIDFYVGPTYAWVNWGNVELNSAGSGATGGATTIATKDQNAWGATVGLDVGLGKRLAVVGSIRYLDVSLETDQGEAGVNPLISRLGIALRF